MAVVVATGVTANGGREILGVDIGDSEDEVFWRGFLRTLRERGLTGVRLVISDQHAGLVAALGRQLQGVTHRRCRVHYADLLIMPMCVGIFHRARIRCWRGRHNPSCSSQARTSLAPVFSGLVLAAPCSLRLRLAWRCIWVSTLTWPRAVSTPASSSRLTLVRARRHRIMPTSRAGKPCHTEDPASTSA